MRLRGLTAPLQVICSSLFTLAQCTLNSASPSVTLCTPQNGATLSSPVNVVDGYNRLATSYPSANISGWRQSLPSRGRPIEHQSNNEPPHPLFDGAGHGQCQSHIRVPLGQAHAYSTLRGITSRAKRSISSACGLNCSSNKSTPASSNSRMRSATCSAVPTRPDRSPRLETE